MIRILKILSRTIFHFVDDDGDNGWNVVVSVKFKKTKRKPNESSVKIFLTQNVFSFKCRRYSFFKDFGFTKFIFFFVNVNVI